MEQIQNLDLEVLAYGALVEYYGERYTGLGVIAQVALTADVHDMMREEKKRADEAVSELDRRIGGKESLRAYAASVEAGYKARRLRRGD